MLDLADGVVDSFLRQNWRRMVSPEYYFGVDNNQCLRESFKRAELRILVVFLSSGASMSASYTFNVLQGILQEGDLEKRVFVDYAYFPEDKDAEILKDAGIPYLFGNVSHEPVTSYDLVFVSVSIMQKILNYPHMLRNSGIPVHYRDRAADTRIPPFFLGGAVASELSILFGKPGDALVDAVLYGKGEKTLVVLAEAAMAYKRAGGMLGDTEAFVEHLIENQVLHSNLFYPSRYEWVYADDQFTIKDIRRLDDRLPHRVEYSRCEGDISRVTKKIFHLSGGFCGTHYVTISSGCSGASSCCSFCHEATIAGNYHEKSLEHIYQDLYASQRDNASNLIVFFSYNLNYYSRFMDLIAAGSEYYSSVKMLNERLDMVAEAPEQLLMAKRLGMHRFAGAIEGIGDRVRNKILNKNLSRETLMRAARVIFETGMSHFKAGIIVTGHETETDMEDFMSEMDEIREIRDSVGSRATLQLNFCLTREALTPVHSEGLVRQDQIRSGRAIVSHEPYTMVKGVGRNGTRPVIEVTLENGARITGTLNHPVIPYGMDPEIPEHFVEMQNLSVGDVIQYQVGSGCFSPEYRRVYHRARGFYLDENLAYMVGFMTHNGVWVDDSDGYLVKMRSIPNSVFLSLIFERDLAKNGVKVRRVDDTELWIEGALFTEGSVLHDAVASGERVPDIIMRSPRDVQMKFLSGLFHSAGLSSTDDEGDFTFNLKNRKFAEDVQAIYNNLGVYSTLHSPAWSSRVILSVDHPEALRNLRRLRDRQSEVLPRLLGLRVAKIRRREEEETYYVTTESGTYLTNGIVSHNTPLILYSQIAMRHLERRVIKSMYRGEKNMGDFIERYRKKIRLKFNWQDGGSWITQLLVDFGPAGTESLLEATLVHGQTFDRTLTYRDQEIWEKVIKGRGYKDPLFFCEARPEDWIFPSDHIVYTTDKVKKMWWERTIGENFSTKLCLKTKAQPDTECLGCGLCSPEHIKWMQRRDISDTHTVESVLENLSSARAVDSVRVVVRMKPGWEMYDRAPLSHFITSRFLRADERLVEAFHSVGGNSLQWYSSYNQKGWFSGDWAFDIKWKRTLSESELRPLIDQINAELESCTILRVFHETKYLHLRSATELSFVGVTGDYSLSQLRDALSTFNWVVQKATTSSMGVVTVGVDMPELKGRILLGMAAGKVAIYMTVAPTVNPYLVMASVLKKSYRDVMMKFDFKMMDHGMKVDHECECGGSITYSILKGDYVKRCPECTGRRVLATMMHLTKNPE